MSKVKVYDHNEDELQTINNDVVSNKYMTIKKMNCKLLMTRL